MLFITGIAFMASTDVSATSSLSLIEDTCGEGKVYMYDACRSYASESVSGINTAQRVEYLGNYYSIDFDNDYNLGLYKNDTELITNITNIIYFIGLIEGNDGKFYVAIYDYPNGTQIYQIDLSTGNMTLKGTFPDEANIADFSKVLVDSDSNVYSVSDTYAISGTYNKVYKIDSNGVNSTITINDIKSISSIDIKIDDNDNVLLPYFEVTGASIQDAVSTVGVKKLKPTGEVVQYLEEFTVNGYTEGATLTQSAGKDFEYLSLYIAAVGPTGKIVKYTNQANPVLIDFNGYIDNNLPGSFAYIRSVLPDGSLLVAFSLGSGLENQLVRLSTEGKVKEIMNVVGYLTIPETNGHEVIVQNMYVVDSYPSSDDFTYTKITFPEKLTEEPKPTADYIYDVDDLGSIDGIIGTDADAHSDQVRICDENCNHFMVFGPYANLPEGNYEVTFRLKSENHPTTGLSQILPLGFIDVFNSEGIGTQEHQFLSAGSFGGEDFVEFTLPFTRGSEGTMEFRVYKFSGAHTFTFDEIRVNKISAEDAKNNALSVRFEAEDLPKASGIDKDVQGASKGLVRYCDENCSGYTVFGPYTSQYNTLDEVYEVIFKVKLVDEGLNMTAVYVPIGYVDVTNIGGIGTIDGKPIFTDQVNTDGFTEIRLTFDASQVTTGSLEFRFNSLSGALGFEIDYIEVNQALSIQ